MSDSGRPVSPQPSPAGASGRAFEALREIVLGDPLIQARLRDTRDWDHLVAAVEQLAGERGISITRQDLLDARMHARLVRVGRGV
jgi:hypothetical protein